MFSFAPASRRLKVRDGIWLCLALVFHALLLLIPVTHNPAPEPATALVTVTLLAEDLLEDPFVGTLEAEQEIIPPPQDEPASLPIAERPGFTRQEDPIKEIPAPPAVILTTARLLDIASQFEWLLPQADEHRQLGVFTAPPLPENWRPDIGAEDNVFNGMVVPDKTEIVDRWLAADGSHNVVLSTPTGHTLCGSARPWDPMQPLVEHVMHFRSCGGGGTRSFEMSYRHTRPGDTTRVANSTIN
jgi:hypothetical protein